MFSLNESFSYWKFIFSFNTLVSFNSNIDLYNSIYDTNSHLINKNTYSFISQGNVKINDNLIIGNVYADKMTSVQNIPVKRARVTVMMIQNVKAHLSVATWTVQTQQ